MASEWQKVGLAPTWDYTEQKVLEGVFTGKEENVGPNKSNLYNIEQKGGGIIGVWGNTVLDVRFKNLQVGEEVKIEYLGKMKSEQTGREYHSFEVYHRELPMTKVETKEAEGDVDPDNIPF